MNYCTHILHFENMLKINIIKSIFLVPIDMVDTEGDMEVDTEADTEADMVAVITTTEADMVVDSAGGVGAVLVVP